MINPKQSIFLAIINRAESYAKMNPNAIPEDAYGQGAYDFIQFLLTLDKEELDIAMNCVKHESEFFHKYLANTNNDKD